MTPEAPEMPTINLVGVEAMNHRVDAYGGVLSEECGALLRRFFAGRR